MNSDGTDPGGRVEENLVGRNIIFGVCGWLWGTISGFALFLSAVVRRILPSHLTLVQTVNYNVSLQA